MNRKELENHLKTLDVAYELAKKLYSRLINKAEFDNDWETVREIMNTSHETINVLDRARFETQTLIIRTHGTVDVDYEEIESVREAGLMSDQDYNEYNYNRDVDSYADDADALGSVFGGEE